MHRRDVVKTLLAVAEAVEPLSYMIYPQAFQALPPDVKQIALDRVRKVSRRL